MASRGGYAIFARVPGRRAGVGYVNKGNVIYVTSKVPLSRGSHLIRETRGDKEVVRVYKARAYTEKCVHEKFKCLVCILARQDSPIHPLYPPPSTTPPLAQFVLFSYE